MSIAKNTKETFLEEIIDNLSGNTRELPVDCKPRTREEVLLAEIEKNTRELNNDEPINIDLSNYYTKEETNNLVEEQTYSVINDSDTSSTNTWSSQKIVDYVATVDDVIFEEANGSVVTVNNSVEGYLKNIEILGNTIQNEDNLEDIRSVGDKIEGQELYEIPVLSRSKNLIKQVNDSISGGDRIYCEVNLNKNTDYIISCNKNIFSYRVVICKKQLDSQGSPIEIKQLNLQTSPISQTFNTESNYGELYILFHFSNAYEYYKNNDVKIQLEEGTVATPYEPYQEDKLTILSPVQLEKVGDVADRLIEKDGVWGVEKNVGIVDMSTYNFSRFSENEFRCDTVGVNIPTNVNAINCLSSIYVAKTPKQIGTLKEYGITIYPHSLNHNTIIIRDETVDDVNVINNMVKRSVLKYVAYTPTFIPLPHSQQVKLRTFANKTNISFLTEIEGTIKAQVPKSLGATVNTHTEQISNLNKELDRVKKLEESTVSTVETESDFTVVEQTSNGYFEDVKLEGKTLVNLCNITGTHAIGASKVITPSKPINSTFRIEFNIVESTIVSTSLGIYMKISYKDSSIPISYIPFENKGISIGADGVTVIPKGEISTITIEKHSSVSSGDVKIQDIIIMPCGKDLKSLNVSYFEGLKSVGDGADEIVVSSVKGDGNLFNLNSCKSSDKVRVDIINDSLYLTGIKEYYSAMACKLKLKPNTTYTFARNVEVLTEPARTLLEIFNSKDEKLISNGNRGKITVQFTTDNTGVTRFVFGCNDETNNAKIRYYDIQLKEGKTEVPYKPYISDKKRLLFYNTETQTWEKPILREWDSIEKHSDGKYYYHQRSGEVVLNGSENISCNDIYTGNKENTCIFRRVISTIKKGGGMVSNKFNNIGNPWSLDKEGIYPIETSVDIRILKSKIGVIDDDDNNTKITKFKQWLQANNVTVVYQLAEEKVYECTNIDLITYANETNYVVESGVIVPRTTLKVHNNISNVVSLLQKKVSLLEINITNYMITQNRMQLASTYSADSVTFKVDYALCSEEVESYNEDLYNLILNNILVGKDNYDYDKMFTMILDYVTWGQLSFENFDTLVGLMDIQHNPPIDEEVTEEI